MRDLLLLFLLASQPPTETLSQAFVTADLTVYWIQPGRGLEESAAILRPEFAGGMARDEWGVYRGYEGAVQQSCLNHLSRRCRQMIGVARPGGGALSAPGPADSATGARTAGPLR